MSDQIPSRPVPLVGPDPETPHLLDERSEPDFRGVFTSLAGRAFRIDSAVAGVRLTGLDLRQSELRSVEMIRLVVARVDAPLLRSEAEATLADPARARLLRHLVRRLQAGRLKIRSAPLAGWNPDFSVFHRSGRPAAVVVGLHWFARPYPHRGPALASVHGTAGAQLAGRRFEGLWNRAHDIGPAILNLLRTADDRGPDGGPPRSAPAPSFPPGGRRASTPRKRTRDKGKPGMRDGAEVLDTPTGSG